MPTNDRGMLTAVCAAVLMCGFTWLVAAQDAGNGVEVCIGSDRVLRAADGEKPCPSNTQRYLLASLTVESELKTQPAPKSPSNAQLHSLEDRVRQLERELGDRGVGNTVTAPFVVVDRVGKAILRVDEKAPASGPLAARVLISGGVKDNYSMRIINGGGTVVAAFGENQAGTGAFTANDGDGKPVVSMNGGLRNVSVYNTNGLNIATMAATDRGGELILTDQAGTQMVRAATEKGLGIVLTGPGGRVGGVLGIPSSFIIGKK